MSEMNPNSFQKLAPTWLIVTHLLGAAVMLYFVSHPHAQTLEAQIATPSLTAGSAISVAELDAPSVSKGSPLNR